MEMEMESSHLCSGWSDEISRNYIILGEDTHIYENHYSAFERSEESFVDQDKTITETKKISMSDKISKAFIGDNVTGSIVTENNTFAEKYVN